MNFNVLVYIIIVMLATVIKIAYTAIIMPIIIVNYGICYVAYNNFLFLFKCCVL